MNGTYAIVRAEGRFFVAQNGMIKRGWGYYGFDAALGSIKNLELVDKLFDEKNLKCKLFPCLFTSNRPKDVNVPLAELVTFPLPKPEPQKVGPIKVEFCSVCRDHIVEQGKVCDYCLGIKEQTWAGASDCSVSWDKDLPTFSEGSGCCEHKTFLLTRESLGKIIKKTERELQLLKKLQDSSREFAPIEVEVEDWDDDKDRRRKLKKALREKEEARGKR